MAFVVSNVAGRILVGLSMLYTFIDITTDPLYMVPRRSAFLSPWEYIEG